MTEAPQIGSEKPAHNIALLPVPYLDSDREEIAASTWRVKKNDKEMCSGRVLVDWFSNIDRGLGHTKYEASIIDFGSPTEEPGGVFSLVNTRVPTENISWVDNLVTGVTYFGILAQDKYDTHPSLTELTGSIPQHLFVSRKLSVTAPAEVLKQNTNNLLKAFVLHTQKLMGQDTISLDTDKVLLHNFVQQMHAIKDSQQAYSAFFFHALLGENQVLGAPEQAEIEYDASSFTSPETGEEEFYPGVGYVFSIMPAPPVDGAETHLYTACDITRRVLDMGIPQEDKIKLLMPYQEIMAFTHCLEALHESHMFGFTIQEFMGSVKFPELTIEAARNIIDLPVNAGEIINLASYPADIIAGILLSDEYIEHRKQGTTREYLKEIISSEEKLLQLRDSYFASPEE